MLMRIVHVLDTIGSALLLQVLFVVTSIPIVTALPSAIALQREWAAFRVGDKTTIFSYLAAFRDAWRSAWWAGLLFPVVLGGAVVAILFWTSASGWIGALGTGAVFGLAFLGAAAYLAFLSRSERDREVGWRTWIGGVGRELLARSGRYVLALTALIIWFVILWFATPLFLIGAGIVPAAAAHWAAHPRSTAKP
jgi:hypothetical protein